MIGALSWWEADSQLQGRCKERKKVGNNTWLERRGEDIAVRLHATDVVTIHRDDTYTLNTGGWFTVTTKERLNAYSPARVYSHRGTWYVWRNVSAGATDRWQFFDGIRVDDAGIPLNPMPLDESRERAAETNRLRREITAS